MVHGIGGSGDFLRNAYLSIVHFPSARSTPTDPTGAWQERQGFFSGQSVCVVMSWAPWSWFVMGLTMTSGFDQTPWS
jgi:hypothetical protein